MSHSIVGSINNIFSNLTYKFINQFNVHKMRNITDGISLTDSLLFRFRYTKIHVTKQEIISNINYKNNTTFNRYSFHKKEEHINVKFYNYLFEEIVKLYKKISPNNKMSYVPVDGSSNNDTKNKVCLNMCYYDTNQSIPIDITFNGSENRNKEVFNFKKYLIENPEKFKNVIFVADRFYYTYGLFEFLISNNYKFIIRGKNKCNDKSLSKLKKINKDIRLVKYENNIKKCAFIRNSKKSKHVKVNYLIKNQCNIITNVKGVTDNELLKIYRKRWDIETFFKFIKTNFKFQHLTEKNNDAINKTYICEQILIYIQRLLLIVHNEEKNDNLTIENVNNSNLLKGIYDCLLEPIITGTLKMEDISKCISSYLIKINNKKNRHFPRKSNIPFTKWYIKEYSEITKISRILNAVIDKTVNKLNKNEKIIANRITILNVYMLSEQHIS